MNDVICLRLGIYVGLEGLGIKEALAVANPIWTFGPPESFAFAIDVAKFFSPDYFVTDNPTGKPIPVLWYFIPLLIGITFLAFVLFISLDHKNFSKDTSLLLKKIREAENHTKHGESNE